MLQRACAGFKEYKRYIERLRLRLECHGAGHILSMALFSEFNLEYTKYFSKKPPTHSTVGIELMPGALVEILAIAYKELRILMFIPSSIWFAIQLTI